MRSPFFVLSAFLRQISPATRFLIPADIETLVVETAQRKVMRKDPALQDFSKEKGMIARPVFGPECKIKIAKAVLQDRAACLAL